MLKAIIVDDDKIFTKFVQQCVDWDAMKTEVLACAANGNEAIKLVTELRPDIIVMDVEMPGVSGLECVEYIRSIRHECEIVLVTGHDEFRYAQLGAKFGVTEILLQAHNEAKSWLRSETCRERALDEALALIQQHCTDPKFSISTLSEMMHFHEGYLRRVFKAAFNKSPNTALKETRMKMTIELFAAGDMQIQQIAKMVGFDDSAYFSKCFKQYFGYAPSEYRKVDKGLVRDSPAVPLRTT